MLTPDELSAIKARYEAATPGEWKYRPQEFDDWGVIRAGAGHVVAKARGDAPLSSDAASLARDMGIDPYGHNALSIIAARTDIPALLAHIEGLEAALRSAIEVADEARDEWDAAPSGTRAGKLLIALSGRLNGYRPDIDAIHAALGKAGASK